ncbi:MAG TPA: GtrA family protein [Polyangiales bacterium]|nr:GtrA family protein [Polyangiales bacterium]
MRTWTSCSASWKSRFVPHETWVTRAFRFGRALVVGSGATLVDFSIFTTCVRAIEIAPTQARLPALLAGACVQFVGSRGFTFRARAGRLSRQVKLFVAAESITLALNWSVFQLLIRHVRGLPPELVSFLGTGLVFVFFAYPVRRLVIFKLPAELVRSDPPH